MNTLRGKIHKIYYDWANDPEFVRIEKYPNDKKPEDTILRAIRERVDEQKDIFISEHGKNTRQPQIYSYFKAISDVKKLLE